MPAAPQALGFKLQVFGHVAKLLPRPALYVTAQYVVFIAVELTTVFNIIKTPFFKC
jgi:hypothetical protein